MIIKKVASLQAGPLPSTHTTIKTNLDLESVDDSTTLTPPKFFIRYPLEILESTPNYGYQHKTTDLTIKVKYKDPKGKKTFEENYECKNTIIPNNEMLEAPEQRSIRQAKVQIAENLSNKIRYLLLNGELKRYIKDKKRITVDDFIKCMRVAAIRGGDFAATSTDDDEIIALTAYYLLKEKFIDEDLLPGFNNFPDGLLTPGDAKFLPRIGVLAKHHLIDMKGIKKPADILNLDSSEKEFTEAKLRIINEAFSPQDLFNFLFPGFQEGDNPPIPTWRYFQYKDKWLGDKGKELARKASRWVLKSEGAIKDNEKIDLNILRTKNWSKIFYDKKYNLGGMLVSCSHTKNILEAIKLAIPEAIGLRENQIKPWEITYNNMWTIEDSEQRFLIDHVTSYLITKHLPKKHGITLIKENGRLDISKVRELNWKALYDEVATSALKHSPFKFNEALKRVYPDSFGYKDDQLKDWELKWDGKWDGEHGKKRFNRALAFTFAKDGLGYIDFTHGIKVIFTKESLENKLKECRPDLKTLLKNNGLEAGLKTLFKGNLNEAVSIIFNADESIPKTRNIISYLQSIIEHNGGKVEIILESQYKSKDIYKMKEDALKGKNKEKKEATKELMPLAKAGDGEAQNTIIDINEFLILDVIKKYYPFINEYDGFKRDDYIQEGKLAIWKAISSYDEKEGEFSTHAFWKIRGRIQSLLEKETKHAKRFKPLSQLSREVNDESQTPEGLIEDSPTNREHGKTDTTNSNNENYTELCKKIETGISLLEKELEQLKTDSTPRGQIVYESTRKEIIALRLRLFENKNFDEIATVFGTSSKKECGRQPFIRGLKKLLPLLGVNNEEDACTFFSNYTS